MGSSAEMQEEILRQITDEGLLDGIDLNNMNVAQEDELSERIADAYRRRHRQRTRSQDAQSEDSRGVRSRSQRSDENQPRQRHQARSSGMTDQGTHSSHPPVSRPHLLEAHHARSAHRRRTSSGTRQPPSPEPGRSSRRSSSEVQRQGARSATVLSDRPRSSQADQGRPRGLSS
ncbi:ring finger domain protein [Lasallia pustulata]|uniref:Ring finger domain protein n=1 Tax=Lasallia pustulata TaxID=136370 RepID=A0A1W5CT51_9LECA|nr:ring finger domain protein [Lasallia pustulata]